MLSTPSQCDNGRIEPIRSAAMAQAPTLPDGLVVVVKEECATCRMVVPVIAQLVGQSPMTVYVQDDPTFLGEIPAVMDDDLALSWHHEIETVPTLIKVRDGEEVDRTVGWARAEWERVSGTPDLGNDLPAFRPGCGSAASRRC